MSTDPTPAEIEAVKVLIAHTRTDIPTLLAWVEHLEAEQASMRREAAILRWAADRADATRCVSREETVALLRLWADEFAAGTLTISTDTTEESDHDDH